MAVSSDYLQYVLEQVSSLPRVTTRRMFGAVGLYSDGVFFALIDDDTLFFKVSDANRADYVSRNMAPFKPFRDKPDLSLSYYEVPADALEDRDELGVWARKSIAAAVVKARGVRKALLEKPEAGVKRTGGKRPVSRKRAVRKAKAARKR